MAETEPSADASQRPGGPFGARHEENSIALWLIPRGSRYCARKE